MKIIQQPNTWSCMPAAFATVTGVPFETLIESIGHDGSAILFPDLDDPLCRRGFLGQELVRASLRFGFLFGTFEANIIGYLDDDHCYEIDEENLLDIMIDYIGVIGPTVNNRLHSVAWDGSQCYDPTGFIYPLDRYQVQVYYRLGRAQP